MTINAHCNEHGNELQAPRGFPRSWFRNRNHRSRDYTRRLQRRQAGPVWGRGEQTKRAIGAQHYQRLLQTVDATSNIPAIDRLKLALFVYAKLDARTIAMLTLADVTSTGERLRSHIKVPGVPCCSRRSYLAMHPRVADAIKAVQLYYPTIRYLALAKPQKKLRRQSVTALLSWFGMLCEEAGLADAAADLQDSVGGLPKRGELALRSNSAVWQARFAPVRHRVSIVRTRKHGSSTVLEPQTSLPCDAPTQGDMA